MTNFHGYSGNNHDRWVERNNSSSAMGKVQKQFWFTKSAVMRKFGKKEDEHVVASDAELDAKIDLFKAIESSTKELQVLLADYQNRIYNLAQEENSLGRLLKEYGKQENSRAGKMMVAVGKSLSYTAQQRVAMRNPLVRLFQEVDTFQTRAVEDTSLTVEEMEKLRTEYRGALMWMKNISQDFNPDHFQQLEKFREVQALVKHKKSKFDQIKIKSLQKIELLAASRCNMFSHALILYQNNLITFSEKTAKILNSVASNFKGYHPYRFQVIKELAEPQALLEAEDHEDEKHEKDLDIDDKTFFGAEYRDESSKSNVGEDQKDKKVMKYKLQDNGQKKVNTISKNLEENLVDLEDRGVDEKSKLLNEGDSSSKDPVDKNVIYVSKSISNLDLLSDDVPLDSNMSTQELLKDLFDSPVHETVNQSLPVYGCDDETCQSFSFDFTPTDLSAKLIENKSQMFLPSQLIDFDLDARSYKTDSISCLLPSNPMTFPGMRSLNEQLLPSKQKSYDKQLIHQPCNTSTPVNNVQLQKAVPPHKESLKQSQKLDWYKVFQDIDPLADPANAIFGKQSEDRKC